MSQSSPVPDHCRAFALSDPKDSAYQARCGLAAQTENLSSEEREEL